MKLSDKFDYVRINLLLTWLIYTLNFDENYAIFPFLSIKDFKLF